MKNYTKTFLKTFFKIFIPVEMCIFGAYGIIYYANLNNTHTANTTQPSIDTVYVHDTIFIEHP